MAETTWFIAESNLAEDWDGPHATRDEAVEKAIAAYPAEAWIAPSGEQPDIAALFAKSFDCEWMLDSFEESLSGDGQILEDERFLIDATAEQRKALESAVAAAFREWLAQQKIEPRRTHVAIDKAERVAATEPPA